MRPLYIKSIPDIGIIINKIICCLNIKIQESRVSGIKTCIKNSDHNTTSVVTLIMNCRDVNLLILIE